MNTPIIVRYKKVMGRGLAYSLKFYLFKGMNTVYFYTMKAILFLFFGLICCNTNITKCETCLSLVSLVDVLDNIKTPLNTTVEITRTVCRTCPAMNQKTCSDIIMNLSLIYKECSFNKYTCSLTSCIKLNEC